VTDSRKATTMSFTGFGGLAKHTELKMKQG